MTRVDLKSDIRQSDFPDYDNTQILERKDFTRFLSIVGYLSNEVAAMNEQIQSRAYATLDDFACKFEWAVEEAMKQSGIDVRSRIKD